MVVLTPDNLLEEFTRWLILSGRKPSTVKSLASLLRLLTRTLTSLTSENITKHITELQLKGSSSSCINNFINVARVYYHFCKERGYEVDEGLSTLKFKKDKYRIRSTMADDEIEALLALPREANTGFKKHNYWTVFFSICAYTGMRPGEVSGLKIENVDFGRGIFVLEDTKTNEPRFVPIPPNITNLIKDWVTGVKKGYLFKSSRPEGYTSNVEWHYNFHTRIKKLGIVRPNLTPYSLRHSLITRLLEEDVNIFKVQKIVGHHDLRTTAHYTHLTTKDIIQAIQKHPLIRKQTDPEFILSALETFFDSMELNKDIRFKVKKIRSNGKLHLELEII